MSSRCKLKQSSRQGQEGKEGDRACHSVQRGLNSVAAQNRNVYEIAPIVKTTGKKPTTKIGKPVTPASAVYSATNDTVMLVPKNKLNLAKPEQLRINAALVTDILGRPIDGNDDGQVGGDYVANFSKSGVTVIAAALARSRGNAATTSAMIDTMLDRDELSGSPDSFRTGREERATPLWLRLSNE